MSLKSAIGQKLGRAEVYADGTKKLSFTFV